MPEQEFIKNLSILENFQSFRLILERLLTINALPIFKISVFPLLLVSGILFAGWFIICASDASEKISLTFYSLVVLVAHIQVGTKVCTFIWSREQVTKFLNWIEQFYVVKKEDAKIRDVIEDQLTSTLNAAKMCSRAVAMAYGSTAVALCTFFLYKGDAFIYRFPVPSNDPSWLHLTLLQIYQCFTVSINTFLIINCDSTVATLGIHIMGILRILCALIRSLEDSFENCSDFLRRIQSLHSDIIQHSRAFNDLLFYLLIVQLFSSIFLIFMNLSAIRSDAVGVVFYFLAGSSIIQLLLICLFGEVIFMRYSQVERCLQLTTWYKMTLVEQKKFILILRMAQKPYGLKAGGMYDVSMPTFIDIMKLAISYCAILYTIIE